MEQPVAGGGRDDLSAAIGAEQRDAGKTLAPGQQVAIVAAEEQRAATDAREQQRKVRRCLDDAGQQLAHFLFGGQRLAQCPGDRLAGFERRGQGQRAVAMSGENADGRLPGADFDGDPVLATKKGINFLDRGGQVQMMAEFQKILDFPPAPKLGLDGMLNEELATAAELRGQKLFFGKARCSTCHVPPYYTDHSMHDLELERFFAPKMINGILASGDGPMKTFVLRGLKDSPPYLHDGRLLTIEDTVEFFNLVLGTRLSAQEKSDLTEFLYTL